MYAFQPKRNRSSSSGESKQPCAPSQDLITIQSVCDDTAAFGLLAMSAKVFT